MRRTALPVFLALAAACVPLRTRAPLAPPAPPPPPAVERLEPARWPALADDLPPESLENAVRESVAYLGKLGDKLHAFGAESIGTRRLIDTLEELARTRREAADDGELDRLLRERFDLYRINRSTEGGKAHFSAYYQPVLEAARAPDERFKYPLFAKPTDLIEAPLGDFKKELAGETLVGRVSADNRFVPYFDRRDIDVRGALAGRGLELAWLAHPFDRLNLHIQGSGLLQFTDGTEAIAAYAATNARPYASVGLALIGSGAMTREQLSAEVLRRYLEEHPEGEAWLLSRNPRYTFYKLDPLPPGGEPKGTIDQPLTAGRSIAVDPKTTPLGLAGFMAVPLPQADAEGRLLGKSLARRLVLCQDTGGAITGPGRVDIYQGHGPQAKAAAHGVWDTGELYILLKKLPPRQR